MEMRGTKSGECMHFRNIFVHVTKACNQCCEYCYFSARDPLPDELSRDEYRQLWPQIVTSQPDKIVFTGGEPLMREDMLDLISDAKNANHDHRVLLCLNSNGRLLSAKLVNHLVGLIDEVRISIDALAVRNDSLRGQNSFENSLRAMEHCRDAGINLIVFVTVTRRSLPDLEALISFLIQRGFISIHLTPFRPIGRGANHNDWRVTEREIDTAIECALRHFGRANSTPQEPELLATQITCGVGRYLNIMPNGDIFPCHVLTGPEFKCGNVRKESLNDICRTAGLLDILAHLDFGDLARRDVNLADLTQPRACMGEIYAQFQRNPVWQQTFQELARDRVSQHLSALEKWTEQR
jgi:MoaA/NifB/PqqE/SkfB family radical SAM enzyme